MSTTSCAVGDLAEQRVVGRQPASSAGDDEELAARRAGRLGCRSWPSRRRPSCTRGPRAAPRRPSSRGRRCRRPAGRRPGSRSRARCGGTSCRRRSPCRPGLERAAGLRRALGVERDLEVAAVGLDRGDVGLGRVERLLRLGELAARPSASGASTVLQPAAAALVRSARPSRRPRRALPPSSSPSPQPATASSGAGERAAASTGAGMGGDDNAPRAALPALRTLRPRAARPRRLPVGRRRAVRRARPRRSPRCARRASRPVPHQRRPPRTGGVRAQALAARLPGLARRGRDRRRRAAVPARRARRAGTAFVSARRRWSTTSPPPACGSSTARRSPRAPTSWWSAATTTSTTRELRTPTQAVLRGAELIGATRDATFPMPDGPWPGTGAVLAAVEAATGRTRRPHRRQARAADVRGGAATASAPGRVLAVGDRLDVDVAGARRAGLDAALVLTGATPREQADAAEPAPDPRRRLARRRSCWPDAC